MNWIKELKYIKSVSPEFPGKTFNNDSSCFARYCDMQLKQAMKEGQYLNATEILDSRDCAIHYTGLIRSVWVNENNGYHQALTLSPFNSH